MKLEIQIDNVAAETASHYFIAVQLDYKDNHTPPIKLRTNLAQLTHRPKFKRNLFSFEKLIDHQSLKFGLMACPGGSQDSINQATLAGIGSISLSLSRLRELPEEGESKLILILNKRKEVGQFQCTIRFREKRQASSLQNSKSQLKQIYEEFNPLVSRVLYSEEVTKDEIRMNNNIKQLEKQSQMMYDHFKGVKTEEQTLQKIYSGLEKDQEQLKNEIELNEKINEKIALKMSQRQSSQALRLQIDMLRNSDEGKGLLLEKLEYYQERIQIEKQEHMKLSIKYDKIKDQLDARIKRAQNYAQKLKGKELQLFELAKNRQILKKYDDVEYQFSCNQHIIEQLVKKAKKSQLSADQAALILSQVNYKIKMEQVEAGFDNQDTLINMIEREAEGVKTKEDREESQEQKLVLGIKLEALEEQIFVVKGKIQQTLAKKQIKESGVRRL